MADEIDRQSNALASVLLDQELQKQLKSWEDAWTQKGVPDDPERRFYLGLACNGLVEAGCSRELLHDYIDAALDLVASIGVKTS